MKGIVFTEFLDMVEEVFSHEVADMLIGHSGSATGGSYTSVGTYDHQEMMRMVAALSDHSGTPVDVLLRRFGQHMAGSFVAGYGHFFDGSPTLLDFLASIDGHIHVEVRKLYPDAELPSFQTLARDPTSITLLYRSSRHLQDLAHGLIEGCAWHYGTAVGVVQVPQGDAVCITVTYRDGPADRR